MEDRIEELRQWILEQKDPHWELKDEGRRILLSAEYAEGVVCFNPMDIIEYMITSRQDEETVFYLHFQLKDMEHAQELFHEMTEALLELKDQQEVKILLSCSSALTTSFFAAKLTESAKLLGMPYVFDAVSADHLEEKGSGYRAILLAPQEAFLLNKAKRMFPDRPVATISGKLYGAYDVRGVLKLADDLLKKKEEKKETSVLATKIPENNARILAITTRIDTRFRIVGRIYDHGVMESETVSIKNTLKILDIADLLDSITAIDDDFDAVVLSVPGVVHNGKVQLTGMPAESIDLKAWFTERYPYRFYFMNNANSTVLGIYASEGKNGTVVYHSQMTNGKAGQGILIDGKLVTGHGNIAGEVNYILDMFRKDHQYATGEMAAEVCAQALLADISTIGPDRVYIHCGLIPDAEPVRKLLKKFIEEEYIPEITVLSSATEFKFAGELMYCLQKMQEEKIILRRERKNAASAA